MCAATLSGLVCLVSKASCSSARVASSEPTWWRHPRSARSFSQQQDHQEADMLRQQLAASDARGLPPPSSAAPGHLRRQAGRRTAAAHPGVPLGRNRHLRCIEQSTLPAVTRRREHCGRFKEQIQHVTGIQTSHQILPFTPSEPSPVKRSRSVWIHGSSTSLRSTI